MCQRVNIGVLGEIKCGVDSQMRAWNGLVKKADRARLAVPGIIVLALTGVDR